MYREVTMLEVKEVLRLWGCTDASQQVEPERAVDLNAETTRTQHHLNRSPTW